MQAPFSNLAKALLIALFSALIFAATSVRAQFGQVYFNNTSSPAPIMDGVTGLPASGPNYRVALYSGTDPYTLSFGPAGLVSSNLVSGYFNGGLVSLPPYPPFTGVYLELRAWSPATYSSFEMAANSGDPAARVGTSGVIFRTLGSTPADTQNYPEFAPFVLAPLFGSLQATISPAGAVAAGAKWRVDAGSWQNSAATILGLSPGSHTVSFSTVTGWISPSNQTVTIHGGQTTSITGSYIDASQTGSLQFTLAPAEALTAGAQWRVNGGAWQNSGTILSGLSVGNQEVSFSEIAGWFTPKTHTVTVSAGMTNALAKAYTHSGFLPAGSMLTPRRFHTATLLPSGMVLVAGGYGVSGILSSAELYDPSTGQWSATGPMSTNRYWHTATSLPDGTVLVTGGYGSPTYNILSTAELYDPVTGLWSSTTSMSTNRFHHTATLLPDGKVLVAGGFINGTNGGYWQASFSTAELYDPVANTWTATGSMPGGKDSHTASRLPNGKVLVVGGENNGSSGAFATYLYDIASGLWTTTANMPNYTLIYFSSTLLPEGKVLFPGGWWNSDNGSSSVQIYDPQTAQWLTTNSMSFERKNHTTTLLPSGKVLVAGGQDWNGSSRVNLSSAELYDSTSGTWTLTGELEVARFQHTATLLANGTVLIAGGSSVNFTPFASAELYISQSPATVTLSNLSQSFDGTGKVVSVTTVPPGLAVNVSYNGSADAPTNVGDYTVIGTINDPNYQGASTNTLAIVIPDIATNVTAAQSATIAPGESATASTAPSSTGEAGLSATATNGGGSTLLVAVASYDGAPADVAVFQAGASYMDIRVWGADANDSLSANFYYPSTITGTEESNLVLDYWNGANWSAVLSSGGSLPVKDAADNLDGTLSGGRFAVVFDSTSTPLLTGLTGTVFALAPVVVAPTPPQLNILPVQSDGAFRLEFTNTPGAAFSVCYTTNLSVPFSNWTVLNTITESPPGHFQFTDSQATNGGQRFYRVRSP